MSAVPVTLMIVDDDSIDIMTVKRTLRRMDFAQGAVEARNGIEALARLRGTDGYARLRQPVLVLLDLNMPRMNGLEFLDEIRADDALRGLLVFVMTTSAAEEDRQKAYDRNIAGYILKHGAGARFHNAMSMIRQYCDAVEFPL